MTFPLGVESDQLATWPGQDRRYPSIGDANYLIHREITRSLESARDAFLRPGARMLDVGCGVQPYFPLFARVASEYDGTDVEPGPRVTYVSSVESLPIPDARYDVVLCTQVLEHVRHPQQALLEMTRVLAPDGHLFLTTHGVYPFHPYPGDYWRWTQQGFEAMFEETDGLELVSLVPHGGYGSTVALLIGRFMRDAARKAGVPRLGAAPISVLNMLGLGADRVLPAGIKAALVPNFLAVGRRVA